MTTPQSNNSQIRWLPYKNNCGETVPAFGCVRVTGVQSDGIFTVDKATSANPQLHGFNGPIAVSDGKFGEFTFSLPAIAKYASGTPAVGEHFKPTADAFTLEKNTTRNNQFTVLGIVDASNKLIEVGPC